jgi:hypothetical protein
MSKSSPLPDEPGFSLLRALEHQAANLLQVWCGYDQETVDHIRKQGALKVPCLHPMPGRRLDFMIPDPVEEFRRIVPKTPYEEQAIAYLVGIKEIRDTLAAGDVWGALALTWWLSHDTSKFATEVLYGGPGKIEREIRDQMLSAQIKNWVQENPRIKNAEMARRLRADPKYAQLVNGIQALPKFISRMRAEMDTE